MIKGVKYFEESQGEDHPEMLGVIRNIALAGYRNAKIGV